jgi:hypothetical protein
MLPDGSPLSAAFVAGWQEYQQQLVAEVGALIPEQLAGRAE